jgi:nucleotide-binding universal stress UspA family protein
MTSPTPWSGSWDIKEAAVNKVIACVDGAAYTSGVWDYAVWSAERLDAPLEFLHALDRHPERAPITDFSGSIGFDTQESLLRELAELDEKRSTLAQRHGRELLDEASRRARDAGLARVDSRQRHGNLIEALLELEAQARLFVLGQHHQEERAGRLLWDSNVERVVRSVLRPVLIAAARFRKPKRFVIAFDGSGTGRKMVETVAGSPLLRGLQCHLVTAGNASAVIEEQLDWARVTLAAAGFEVQASLVSGEPEAVLPNYLDAHAGDLLVMGAYGHSRIRQFIVGSTTAALLRTVGTPALVLP